MKAPLALALLALGALGCERSTLTLSLGLDKEDALAVSWLGYYPSHFVPVGSCPTESAWDAVPVKNALTEEAATRLKERFAVELVPGDGLRFSGQAKPKLDPAAMKAAQAELQIEVAAKTQAELDALLNPALDSKPAEHALDVARKMVKQAKEFANPTHTAYLVRGVSFSPNKVPAVTVCYGDVHIKDEIRGTSMPKLYVVPMVVWVGTPIRRGRIEAVVTE